MFSILNSHILKRYWYLTKANSIASILQMVQYPIACLERLIMIPITLYLLYVGTHLFQGTYEAHWKLNDANYFTYVLLGALVLIPNQYAVRNIPFKIGAFIWSGRIATFWNLPFPKALLLYENILFFSIARYFIVLAIIICFAIYQKMAIDLFASIIIASSLAVCVGIYYCLSIIITSVLLIIRKGDIIVFVISLASTYFTGVFVPTKALPMWARVISPFVPITHCLTIIRNALAGQSYSRDTLIASIALAITMGIVLYASRITLQYSIKYLKTSGALMRY